MKTNSLQHRSSQLCNIKRAGQDLEALGWQVPIPCTQQPRPLRTPEESEAGKG